MCFEFKPIDLKTFYSRKVCLFNLLISRIMYTLLIISSQTQCYKLSHMKKATLTQFLFNSLAPQPPCLGGRTQLTSIEAHPRLGGLTLPAKCIL